MRLKRLLFLLICILETGYVQAQQPFFWHLTDDDGLPSTEIYHLCQDRKGYVWIATNSGLCRYDGIRVKLYSTPRQRGKAFAGISQSPDGKIWCVNFAGQILYTENDSLKVFEPFEQIYKSGYPGYTFDKEGNIWVASEQNPLGRYSFKTRTWTYFPEAGAKLSGNSITHDADGDIWVKNGRYLFCVNGKGVMSTTTLDSALVEMTLQYAPKQQKLQFVSVARNSFALYEIEKSGRIIQTGFPSTCNIGRAVITNFVSFSSGNQWLLTHAGAYHLPGTGAKARPTERVLPDVPVSCVMLDREGNYWFGTLKHGIFIKPSQEIYFANMRNSAMPDSRVMKITPDGKNRFYLSHGDGEISIFNIDSNKVVSKITLPVNNDIEAAIADTKRNLIYFSCINLQVYDQLKRKLTGSYPIASVKDISMDKEGSMLMATSRGFVVVSEKNARTFLLDPGIRGDVFYSGADRKATYIGRYQRGVACAVDTMRKQAWLAYTDGLYLIRNGKQEEVRTKENTQIIATSLSTDKLGRIWVSTLQQGIFIFEEGKPYIQLTTADGLLTDYVKLIETANGESWIATEKGIQRYRWKQKSFSNFMRSDGLLTNEVFDIKVYRNMVYLATARGFQWFRAGEDFINKIPPLIHLTSFNVNGEEFIERSKRNFTFEQNNVNIVFSGLALKNRGELVYKYSLNGIDTSWHYSKAGDNEVRYPALPPGVYTFEVKAVNEDNVESLRSTQLSFIIRKPYWRMWWFYTLIGLFLVGSVSSFFLWIIQGMRGRNVIEQELRSSQLTALKAQMNPHFIFNALNSIQEYILLNERKLANSYLGKFSDLMRLYLDMSNRETILLAEELKAVHLYLQLEALRFEEQFSYEVIIDEHIDTDEVDVPPMLIQPYLENSIKHGLLHKSGEKKLVIRFSSNSENELVCMINDNGVGRKRSREINSKHPRSHTSFATGATHRRLELLNNKRARKILVQYHDLTGTDGQPAGTTVIITVPRSEN